MQALTVVDFFCGAGGFSEGFKQRGFKIIYGYDNWRPAVDTFNHNFDLACQPKNILDFNLSIDEINAVPNTNVILGSPPCVSFSSSNKSGNADKSLGISLTLAFLRIVAVKKYQKGSILKAWFMENVSNSRKHLPEQFTFIDLNLEEWAIINELNPTMIAINLSGNSTIINAADYGAFQARKRLISGELINLGQLIIPAKTHGQDIAGLLPYRTLGDILGHFRSPYDWESSAGITDIQYGFEIPKQQLTDHFYDTGIYEAEWKLSRYWKINHPFMGKMSFPENNDKPSRTIMATRISHSRESIIYKCELDRQGDGAYRLPTIRESALIMGFPISYQFLGSEYNKWRLVGNAVCCAVSRALSLSVLVNENRSISTPLQVNHIANIMDVTNLNSPTLRSFDAPPEKFKGSRFRRHPIKDGNLTVTLSNYVINAVGKETGNSWITSIQYGTGKGFPVQSVEDGHYQSLESLILDFNKGEEFLKIINNGFSEKIADADLLQRMYESQRSTSAYTEPSLLVERICEVLNVLEVDRGDFEQKDKLIFEHKKKIPIRQLFALYAINKISTIANSKKNARTIPSIQSY